MPPMKMKYVLFLCLLSILTFGTIGNAFYRHSQYYPSIVYLSKSNASVTVGYFVASNILWIMGYWTMILFFGELRPNENEELWERLKYVATETLMAFAIFREDFSPRFAVYFAVLLYMKIVHWLGEERVDYLERSPILPKLFHARILCLLMILGFVDLFFMTAACRSVEASGPSPHIAFGFEYSILLPSVCFTVLKYTLHCIEIRREAPLQDKAVILLYGQIIFDFIRIVLYFSYLAVMFRLYLLPAFAFRQIFNTMRNFTSAVNDVVSFRKAVKYMNRFCPDASKEELDAADTVCIVCREDLYSGAKKLPCNHIFHGSCLRSWFQRQQTCPTCRLKILDNPTKGVCDQGSTQDQRDQANGQQPSAAPSSICSQNSDGNNAQNSGSGFNQEPEVVPQVSHCLTQSNQICSSGCSSHSISCIRQLPIDHVVNYVPSSSQKLVPSQSPEGETLSSLSKQDLLAVERDTRAGIESRIKCLQSMSKMLDSTIVMMHRYCNASALSNGLPDRREPPEDGGTCDEAQDDPDLLPNQLHQELETNINDQ